MTGVLKFCPLIGLAEPICTKNDFRGFSLFGGSLLTRSSTKKLYYTLPYNNILEMFFQIEYCWLIFRWQLDCSLTAFVYLPKFLYFSYDNCMWSLNMFYEYWHIYHFTEQLCFPFWLRCCTYTLLETFWGDFTQISTYIINNILHLKVFDFFQIGLKSVRIDNGFWCILSMKKTISYLFTVSMV